MDLKNIPLEFMKVRGNAKCAYWTHKYMWYYPYIWLNEEDIPRLPVPFVAFDIHYDCPLGRPGHDSEAITNIIALPEKREGLLLKPDLRKDLKRIARLNQDLIFRENRYEDLERASAWFVARFKESHRMLKRRLEIYGKDARWTAAFAGDDLIAVHIAMDDDDRKTTYYLGCWWNREHKHRCVPTFLLHQDILKAIDFGRRFYDLGIGDEPYKKKWPVVEKMSKCYAWVDADTIRALGLKPGEVELVEQGSCYLAGRVRDTPFTATGGVTTGVSTSQP